MIQRGNRSGLTLESFSRRLVVRRGRGQHLDRDDAIEPGVPRTVDFAHPAGADSGLQLVRAEPRARQVFGLRGIAQKSRGRRFEKALHMRVRIEKRCDATAKPVFRAGVRDERIALRRGPRHGFFEDFANSPPILGTKRGHGL